jgi:SAM-dependent methyltransferase
MSARLQFIEKLRTALDDGAFVKLTLSEPCGSDETLHNVYGRLVDLRGGPHLQLVYRHARKDVTKNIPLAEAADSVASLLSQSFQRGYLFTTSGDWQWHGPGEGGIKAKRASFTAAPSPTHDRPKHKAVTHAPWLTALGVTAPDGTARPGMADKLRQIERYVEILGHLVSNGPLREAKSINVADLGAGKGYLTFAAYDYFRTRGVEVRMTGVESRQELVDTTNRVARDCACDGLSFVHGDIAGFNPDGSLDVLIALHACDTATDDALALGVRNGAQLIVAAPCCHREIRPQITPPEVLAPVLRHGILLEREAEVVTDAARALLLEMHGYSARVFEFISHEHTGKNLMIAAEKLSSPRDPAPLRAQLRELFAFYGIRIQRLAHLLGEL